VPYTVEDYQKQKELNPELYSDSNATIYGQAPVVPEDNIDRMVNELNERLILSDSRQT